MGGLYKRLCTEVDPLDKHSHSDMALTCAEPKGGITCRRSDIELLCKDMTSRMGVMMLAQFGTIVAAMASMKLHP